MNKRKGYWVIGIFGVWILLCWLASSCPASAGEIRVACPLPENSASPAAGVRFYYGEGTVGDTSFFAEVAASDCVMGDVPGTDPVEQAPICSATITGLTDCIEVHIGTKAFTAFTAGGYESGWTQYPGGGNLILKGWPHLEIDTPIYTDTGDGSTSGAVAVVGRNFKQNIEVWVDGTAVIPQSVTCTRVDFPVTAGMFFTLVQEEPVMSADGPGTVTTSYTVQIDPPGTSWRIMVLVVDPS